MSRANARYHSQKSNAKKRGIVWQFTFEEWVNWWEGQLGQDWLEKRGCALGKYQMARKGDKGPYAAWNVECVTSSRNGSDRSINGTASGSRPRKVTDKQLAETERLFLGGVSASAIIRRTGLTSGLLAYHFSEGRVGVMKKHNLKTLIFKKHKHLVTINI